LINRKDYPPHLWFDREAQEAAELYTSIFKNSEIRNTATLHNTPSGTVHLVAIEFQGLEFRLISAGPPFKFTSAVSFLVACDTKKKKSMHCGMSSQKGARRSWRSANIRSVRDMDGYGTDTAFRGR
jgi:predicted 3-demethylubiquinone-9 3-methyltransferase (glyoxalase superfamily)